MALTRTSLAWPLLLIAVCWMRSSQQIGVWRSHLTLWAHAAHVAPYKPRVAVNYGAALLGSGQTQAGLAQWARAQRLATLPHVPIWDRAETERTIEANMLAMREASR